MLIFIWLYKSKMTIQPNTLETIGNLLISQGILDDFLAYEKRCDDDYDSVFNGLGGFVACAIWWHDRATIWMLVVPLGMPWDSLGMPSGLLRGYDQKRWQNTNRGK
jgi:hypothetical protein